MSFKIGAERPFQHPFGRLTVIVRGIWTRFRCSRYYAGRCPPYLHTSRKRLLPAVIENLSLSLAVGDLNVCA